MTSDFVLPSMKRLSGNNSLLRSFMALIAVWVMLLSGGSHASGGSLWESSSSGSLFGDAEPEFLPVDEAFRFESAVADDGNLLIQWEIEEGYYLYEDRLSVKSSQGDELAVTTVRGDTVEKDDPAFGLVNVFYNDWSVTVSPSQTGELTVRYQGCADAGLCYPPTIKKVFWDAPAASNVETISGSEASAQASLGEGASEVQGILSEGVLTALLIFFGIGLGLAFTPCVLPMLPILSSVVVNHQGKHRHSGFSAALAYILGMAVTYSLLGVAMAAFGDAVQMQAWLQQPLVVGVFAAIFIALALAMFGVYELQLPEFLRSKLTGVGDSSKNHGLFGCVVLGVISALVVSPCVSGPLAGVLVYISTTQDMVFGGAALFVMALGMGLPLMVFVLGGKNALPKAGVWMEQVKVVFGVILLMMALYIVKHLFSAEHLALAAAAILIVFTIWAGVLDSVTNALYRGVLLVILIYSISLLASALSGKASFDTPLSFIAKGNVISEANASTDTLSVIKVSPGAELDELLSRAKEQGQPVMLDVLADWCVSCFVMEKEILVKPDVQQMMKNVEIIKVDITEVADLNAEFLKDQNLFGPPAFLFYDASGNQNGRLVGEVSKAEFEQYFQSLTF